MGVLNGSEAPHQKRRVPQRSVVSAFSFDSNVVASPNVEPFRIMQTEHIPIILQVNQNIVNGEQKHQNPGGRCTISIKHRLANSCETL